GSRMLRTTTDKRAEYLSALYACDPGCGNDRWVKIGMAAKEAGLSVEDYDDWSKQATNYGGEADVRARWRSFTAGGGVTAATLIQYAREEGWGRTTPIVTPPALAPLREPSM